MAVNTLKIILQTIKRGKRAKETEKEVDKLNKSLARMAKGAVAGFVAFKTLGKAFDLTIGNAIQSEKLMAATVNVIEATGQAAGVTAAQIDDYAETLQRLSGVDSEVIQGGQNLLLTFKEIKGEGGVFDRATRSMLDMAVAMNQGNLEGIDLKQTAIQLGKALNVAEGDTTAAGMALSALARVGVSFTDSQKEAAKAAVELGDVMGFQNIILTELESEFGGAAEAAGNTLAGSLSRLNLEVGDLGQVLGDALVPIIADVVEGINDWLTVGDALNASIAETTGAGADGTLTYKEYTKSVSKHVAVMAQTLGGANLWIDAQGNLNRTIGEGIFAVDRLVESSVLMSESTFAAMQAGQDLEISERELLLTRQKLFNATPPLVDATGALVLSDEELKVAEEELAEAEKVATEAAKAQAAAAREQAESLEAARGRAAAASIEFNNLAQSLVDATNADLAKVAIDGLDESLKEGLITRGEHAEATRNVMLAFGLATEESLRLANSMGNVNQLFIEGKISSDELVDVIAGLEENEGNLDRTLAALGITFGGVHDVTNEVELSTLALNTAQIELSESAGEGNIIWARQKDRLVEVRKASDETSLSLFAIAASTDAMTASARQATAAYEDLLAQLGALNEGRANLPSGIPVLPSGGETIPSFQHGGMLGRFGLVGERGPELLVGNQVFNNPDVNRLADAIEMLVALGGKMGNTFNVTTSAPLDVGQMLSQAQALAGAQ